MTYKIPLLWDHHTHVILNTILSKFLNISSFNAPNDLINFIRENPSNIIYTEWNSSLFEIERKTLKDLPPTIICDNSFHEFVFNDAAKERYRFEFPELMENIDKKDWCIKNLTSIIGFLENISKFNISEFNKTKNSLLKSGISKFDDLLASNIDAIELKQTEDFDIWTDIQTFSKLSDSQKKLVNGIKIFIDGTLGQKTAALSENYDNNQKGKLNYSDEELKNLLIEISEEKNNIAIHAIGDRATNQIAKILKKLNKNLNVRIEHAELIAKEDAEILKDLDVTLCMQPNFCLDSIDYKKFLPAGYFQKINPFRMLIDQVGFLPGKNLLLGSDMFASDGQICDAKLALKYSLFPPLENQRLTIEEFISGYCVNSFEKGYIEVEIFERSNDVSAKVILN